MESITKYSLVCIFIGLLGLYFISDFVEPKFISLEKIDESHLNEVVKTSGTIESIYLSDSSTLFINMEDKDKILSIVKFNVGHTNLKKGDYIEVEGEIKLYKNDLEIVAREIKKVS